MTATVRRLSIMSGDHIAGRRRSRDVPSIAPGAPDSGDRQERLAGWFLLAVGGGVAGLWAVSLPGAFRQGLFTYAGTPEAGNIPAFHLVDEAGMAVSAVTAGTALLRGWPRRRGWALTACGMLTYSSVNSSGWLLRNQPAVTAVTGLTAAGSLRVIQSLLKGSDLPPQRRAADAGPEIRALARSGRTVC